MRTGRDVLTLMMEYIEVSNSDQKTYVMVTDGMGICEQVQTDLKTFVKTVWGDFLYSEVDAKEDGELKKLVQGYDVEEIRFGLGFNETVEDEGDSYVSVVMRKKRVSDGH